MRDMTDALEMLAFEVAWGSLITLAVGTFSPPLQRWLPWGRAYQAWRRRRMAAATRALERRAAPPCPQADRAGEGTPYRGALPPPVTTLSRGGGWWTAFRAQRAATRRVRMEAALEEAVERQEQRSRAQAIRLSRSRGLTKTG